MAPEPVIPFTKTPRGIRIEVKVEPRSSRKGIAGVMDNGVLKVKLTAPPVEGEANEQLIEVIAAALGVKKSSVRIVRGLSSKRKTLEVEGIEHP
ncbi:MAG: DUF167 domain-containing protein [Thermodesulfovibrionales bacterium]